MLAIPYFVISAITGFIAKLVPNASDSEYGDLTNKRKSTNAKTGFIIICLVLILFSAFRSLSGPGNDEYAYRNRYDAFENKSLSELLTDKDSSEPLITTIFWFATRITTTNQGGIMIVAVLTIGLIMLSLRRDAKDFSYAIVMFFATGCLFSTFNGIAQYLAAAISLYSFKYVYNKQLFKFFIAVCICCMVHSASIILILLYFICNTKLGSAKMYLFDFIFLASIVVLYNLIPVFSTENDLFDLNKYQEIITAGHHGVNILTVIISLAPAIFAVLIAPKIESTDRVTSVTAHMTIINALIYIAGSIDVYIARFALFTDIFVVIFLSRAFKYIYDKYGILKIMTVVLYSCVTLYRMNSMYYTFNFIW